MGAENVLAERMQAVADGMRADLEKIRASFDHAGNKGNSVEEILRTFLREYLPQRLSVGHGEIIDRNGNRSKQSDVVIANDSHPFTFQPNAPGLFFIEGVAATGEIKSVLTSELLAETIAAARTYKRLSAILPAGALFISSSTQSEQYLVHPPYFLFAFESQLNPATVTRKIQEFTASDYQPGESIDAIFILDGASYFDLGDGASGFCIRDPRTKVNFKGWHAHASRNPLFDFLAWLSIVMPTYVGGRSILAPYLIEMGSRNL